MGPIFRSLLKNKLGALLIILQIAMTVAILAKKTGSSCKLSSVWCAI